jgi:primosomal protein N' (replication factor Y) (superfamily II helicase)
LASVARVAPESSLLQLDREFDFFIPEQLDVSVGCRVAFQLGRAKTQHTGFVLEILESSEFATTELKAVLGPPVLTAEILKLARVVAKRQAVALGEILSSAVPDFMPRIELSLQQSAEPTDRKAEVASPATGELIESALKQLEPIVSKLGPPPNTGKHAYLCSVRPVDFAAEQFPDWALVFAAQALARLSRGQSALLITPEREESRLLERLFLRLGVAALDYGHKKAERYRSFRALLDGVPRIVIGNRAALYAPAAALGLICLFDDLDDSLRDQSSPYLHARELALMRDTDIVLASNYRSPDVARLVKIGYLEDHGSSLKPPPISFSEPGSRLDAASFQLLRQALELGPLLVLTPNRGNSSASFCADCNQRLRCQGCGGQIWSPTRGDHSCRLCKRPATSCPCGSTKIRPGRAGSERTTADLGRAFPGATVVEANATKKPAVRGRQIVVATPGSAPRISPGYAAVLVLDAEVWLSRETLRAEQLAIRDWQEAIALLAPGGRALLASVSPRLGKTISLQLLREHAAEQLDDLTALKLPPAVRIATVEGDRPVVLRAIAEAERAGADLIRLEGDGPARATLRFSFGEGIEVATALKTVALTATPRQVSGRARRGLKIVMDDQEAI